MTGKRSTIALTVAGVSVLLVALTLSIASPISAAPPRDLNAALDFICFECGSDSTCDTLAQGYPHHFDDDAGSPTHADDDSNYHDHCMFGYPSEGGDMSCQGAGHSNECVDHGRELDLLLPALSAGDAEAVAELIDASTSLTLNVERGAIQQRACRGDAIVRHIPVSPSLLEAVSLALQ
jgi:hypothetical protein